MESKVADRIIELAWKWQNRVTWDIAYEAADEWQKYRDKADQDWATAKRIQDSGQHGEMLELFRHDAERNKEIAETCHKQVIASHQDLLNLANLLREHAPKLLRLVPVVNFHEAPPADLARGVTVRNRRAQRRLHHRAAHVEEIVAAALDPRHHADVFSQPHQLRGEIDW